MRARLGTILRGAHNIEDNPALCDGEAEAEEAEAEDGEAAAEGAEAEEAEAGGWRHAILKITSPNVCKVEDYTAERVKY